MSVRWQAEYDVKISRCRVNWFTRWLNHYQNDHNTNTTVLLLLRLPPLLLILLLLKMCANQGWTCNQDFDASNCQQITTHSPLAHWKFYKPSTKPSTRRIRGNYVNICKIWESCILLFPKKNYNVFFTIFLFIFSCYACLWWHNVVTMTMCSDLGRMHEVHNYISLCYNDSGQYGHRSYLYFT